MKSLLTLTWMSCFAATGFASGALGATDAVSSVNQVCLNPDGAETHCFLEVVAQGRSSLYTTDRDYMPLALNETLTQWNAEFQVISEEEYLAKVDDLKPASYVFSPERVDAFDFASSEQCTKSRGWWAEWGKCAAGTIGGAGLGAMGGGALGPVGGVLGGLFGGMTGAASSCGYKIYAHFNDMSYDVTESQAWKPLRRCT